MRRESFGGAELFLADSREITGLPYHDVVVSDPPFSIPHNFSPNYGPHGKRTLGFGWDTKIDAIEIVNVFARLFGTADAAFIFCGLRQATPLAEAMAHNKLIDKMACWRKPYPPPPGPANWWPSAFELAIYGYRPGAWFGDDRPTRHNVFLYDALRAGNGEKNGHPTQKPVALLDRIIGSIARPNAVVIDPFMGSGTTGVAALRLGRRFVGVEIEECWFDLACRRIETEARQGHLALASMDGSRG